MSKHNSKNTLSFVGLALALMAATPVAALPTMRIAGAILIALGFQVGDGPKVKAKKDPKSLQAAWTNILGKLDGVKDHDAAVKMLVNDIHSNANKSLTMAVDFSLDRRQDITAYNNPAITATPERIQDFRGLIQGNPNEAILTRFLNKDQNATAEIASKVGVDPSFVPETDETKAIKKAYADELKSLDASPANLANKRWKGLKNEVLSYTEEDIKGSTIDAVDNSFWRRFQFAGELEITWPLLDEALRLGLIGSISGNLYKSTFKDRGDLSDTSMIAFRIGVALNITKWIEFYLLGLTERHSVSKDKLSDKADDDQNKAYTAIKSTLDSFLSAVQDDESLARYLDGSGKEQKDYQKALSDVKEAFESEKKAWEFNGWTFGLEIRLGVPMWITENIALKVGLAWTIPMTTIKSSEGNREFTPSQRILPYIGVVFAI